jgi:hypothetical protein
MNHLLLLLLVLLTTSFNVSAADSPKTHILVLGGSGDPAGASTIFDPSLSKMGDYFLAKQQLGELGQSSVNFNGGHSATDAIKNTRFQNAGKIQDFTTDTYKNEVMRFKAMMQNNSVIKPGEQLLVYINSHGGAQAATDDPKTGTHSIAVGEGTITNTTTAEGADLTSVDQVAQLKAVAAKFGVKLAIVDLSCHSGNTQNLADSNTCVVSATGRNHFAYTAGGFNGSFTGNMQPGETLESAFLKTRSEDTAADFPMISSPESKLIEEQIYGLMGPYLQYRGSPNELTGAVADKLTDDLIKNASSPQAACVKNYSFEQLNKLLTDLEKASLISRKAFSFQNSDSSLLYKDLKNALKEYKNVQDQLTLQFKNIHAEKLNNIEAIPPSNHYTWAELLSTDFAKNIAYNQDKIDHDQTLSKEDRDFYRRVIAIYDQANTIKAKVIRENPNLAGYKNIVANFDQGQEKTIDLAGKVALLEKKLFDRLYRKYARENSQSNPCRDFKL